MATSRSNSQAQQDEQRNSSDSILLRQPAEIREEIIKCAVIEEAALDIVCRQLRREALPIFYHENTFQLPCTLKPKVRAAVQTITPRDHPDWLLTHTAETKIATIMQYSHNLLVNLETARCWLRTIGAGNQRLLKNVVLLLLVGGDAAAASDVAVLQELCALRWDSHFLRLEDALVGSKCPPLIEGWDWEDREEGSGFARPLPADDGSSVYLRISLQMAGVP
ncbi:Hypothetical predicted protein [Lecanosticta acicola]|uniref:Uncharacterized protein n=1 Tax=Lecanosticta acicola TaxID=111012 RepID=A0AAI8Z7B0_9PEZI|nr:Hypothetical predicted protein [Lecanosticta acicola]